MGHESSVEDTYSMPYSTYSGSDCETNHRSSAYVRQQFFTVYDNDFLGNSVHIFTVFTHISSKNRLHVLFSKVSYSFRQFLPKIKHLIVKYATGERSHRE